MPITIIYSTSFKKKVCEIENYTNNINFSSIYVQIKISDSLIIYRMSVFLNTVIYVIYLLRKIVSTVYAYMYILYTMPYNYREVSHME